MKQFLKSAIIVTILVLIGLLAIDLFEKNSNLNTDSTSYVTSSSQNETTTSAEETTIEEKNTTENTENNSNSTNTQESSSTNISSTENNSTLNSNTETNTTSDNSNSTTSNETKNTTERNETTSKSNATSETTIEIEDTETSSSSKTSTSTSTNNNDTIEISNSTNNSSTNSSNSSTSNSSSVSNSSSSTNSSSSSVSNSSSPTNSSSSSASNSSSSTNSSSSSASNSSSSTNSSSSSASNSSSSTNSSSSSAANNSSSTNSSNSSASNSSSSTNSSSSSASNSSSSTSSSSSSAANSSSSTNSSSSSTDTTTETVEDGNIIGATGYSALNNKQVLRKKASNSSKKITVLEGGKPFRIISTNSDDTWWKVEYQGQIGYVENAYCMINLPDYIPSITYSISFANKSKATSSGVKLSIYNQRLYAVGKVYNERLGKKEYIVPVMYSFAKKIYQAQQEALSQGYSLKIYDAYRPTSVSKTILASLKELYNSNSTVKKNINYAYDNNGNKQTWGISWFLAQNLSAHNLGAAIDVSLTEKDSTKDLEMPTNVLELSTKAIKYQYPVSGQTKVREDLYASTMTTAAKKLDEIMTNQGLTTLASEWWHFQDNEAYKRIKAYESSGLDYKITEIVSE